MWNDQRWRSVTIAISLLLNVFLLGIVGGHFFGAGSQTGGGGRPDPGIVPGNHVRALPPEERRRFLSVMKRHRDVIRAARQAHRAARQAVEAAIAAPTYDHDAVVASFATLRQSNLVVQEAVNAALVDALQDLSPQARASLVQHPTPNAVQPAAPH